MKETSSPVPHPLPTAILLAATSMTALAYEIVLMRLLSISVWHHLAYMVISMALLGFGASGSILFLIYDRIEKHLYGSLIVLTATASISFSFCFSLSQKIGLDPLQIIWQPAQWILMWITYFLMSIPFLLAGSIIGIILTSTAEKAHLMYAVDLMGAGSGALIIVPALYSGPPWRLLPFLGLVILIGAIGCCLKIRRPLVGIAIILTAGFILAAVYFCMPPTPKIHDTKALPMTLSFPEARVVTSRYGPLGMIDVVESSQIHHVPGLSLSFGLNPETSEANIPAQKAIFIDADGLSPVTSFTGDMKELMYLNYTSIALPYHIRDQKKVMSVGAGGGSDILLGLLHNAEEITGIEANRQIADLMLGPFSGFSGHLFTRPGVCLEVKEARQFLRSTEDKYDLIQLSLIDSFVNSAGGLHSSAEDYLYTVEAFEAYLNHLTKTGVLAITRWLKLPPRDSLRTISIARTALLKKKIREPERYILFIRSWKTFTILVSISPFTEEDIVRAKGFCAARNFDLAYYAGMKIEDANKYDVHESPYYYNGANALFGAEREVFLKNYLFDVSDVADDRPFFSHFFRWKKAIVLFKYLSKEWLPIVEMGYIFILATLAQALIAGGLFILMPLFIFKWLQSRSGTISLQLQLKLSNSIGPLFYFGCIGLGFMFLEITFIPKYTLILSHPVYAATTVLTTLLVSAGFGSLAVRRFQVLSPRFLWIPVLVISCWVSLNIIAGDRFVDRIMGSPFWARLSMTVLILSIPSFFMGWLFPTGLIITSRKNPSLVPWAWGVNGCASVAGAVLSKCLAVNMGFNVVMIIACLLYSLAVAVFYVSFND
ncbi:MAG: SAM-dependent methyltransferase [Deltaproteobacteria bacterium]|nr:SAM-dependent methyltransferase [Deltaproteobacteria bacterium]